MVKAQIRGVHIIRFLGYVSIQYFFLEKYIYFDHPFYMILYLWLSRKRNQGETLSEREAKETNHTSTTSPTTSTLRTSQTVASDVENDFVYLEKVSRVHMPYFLCD